MSMLCIFGFCIPYSVLWPIALLFIKQIWNYIFPASTTSNESKIASNAVKHNNANTSSTTQCETIQEVEKLSQCNNEQSIDFTNTMIWEQLVDCNTKVIIIRFTAHWCKPCNEITPYFNQLYKEYKNKAYFININVDDFENIAAMNKAISIPYFVSYYSGKLLKSIQSKDATKIKQFIDESISNY